MGCYGARRPSARGGPLRALIPWYLGGEFADAVPIVQLMGVATIITGITRTFALRPDRRRSIQGLLDRDDCRCRLAPGHRGASAALIGGAEGVAVAICGTQLFMGAAMGYAIHQGPPRRPRHLRAESDRAFPRAKEQQR